MRYNIYEDEKYPVYTIHENPPWYVRILLKITAEEYADYVAARDAWEAWQEKLAKWSTDPARREIRKYEVDQ